MKRALSVENLSVTYGRGKERLQVLKRVSFFLKKGELLTLLGESGSGKTTCGKVLLGMLPPRPESRAAPCEWETSCRWTWLRRVSTGGRCAESGSP